MKDTEININGKRVAEYDICPDDNRPDFDENDSNSPTFMHNRPCHKEKVDSVSSYKEIDVISAKSGDIFRLDKDINSDDGASLTIAYIITDLKSYAPEYKVRFKQVYRRANLNGEFSTYWDLNSTFPIMDIGSGDESIFRQNRVCAIQHKGSDTYRIYFVVNKKYLNEEYKSKFTKNGIYLEFVKPYQLDASEYCRMSIETYHYHKFDPSYIPNRAFLVPEPVSDDKGKFLRVNPNGEPEWQDDIPEATAADAGKVLMVGADGKPVWTSLPTSTGTGG